MREANLIDRLVALGSPSPATCFVLLWTYFQETGLGRAENLARARWVHPLQLEPYLPPDRTTTERIGGVLKTLQASLGTPELDLLALRWLKGLDLLLREGSPADFEQAEIEGLDGRPYRVRRRNSFLARHFEAIGRSVRWSAHQSASLAAYCQHHLAVPGAPVQGRHIRCLAESDWGGRHLHGRLRMERDRLKIMLWPFQVAIDYEALELLGSSSPPSFIRLDTIRNETEVLAEARQALDQARQQQATLLVFPELAVPPMVEDEIREHLARNGPDGYPILTLVGCCHRAGEAGDLNEAVLLGPDGTELSRHRKLAAFTDYRSDGAIHVGERLEVGDTVSVLECAFGNLTPLICLDLLNLSVGDVVRRSHGNVFLVPSLSPQTRAHQTAARQLQASQLASTFVCNRWLQGLTADATSFYQLPRSGDGFEPHLPDPGDRPYLLFSLDEP